MRSSVTSGTFSTAVKILINNKTYSKDYSNCKTFIVSVENAFQVSCLTGNWERFGLKSVYHYM